MGSRADDLAESSGLEVVVQHAGLALHSAALERTRGSGRPELIARVEATADADPSAEMHAWEITP